MRTIISFLLLCVLFMLTKAQILAVDFGTEYVKSALVSSGSGKAFQIVLTGKSQRKFLNSIGFYQGDRFYESESLTKRPKFPTNCFIFNKLLVDSVQNPELKSTIKKDLLLDYIKDDMEDPLRYEFFLEKFPEETKEVTLIQAVAMLLKYARHNAETEFKTSVKDVVLTVPNYWNIKMRAFLIEAAQVADLYVLSIISENTGAALNYALNQRTKNTTETILFYNLGSNALQMTLAQFKQVPDEKSSKPVESIFILGDYGESYVGGLRFDNVLFQFFKERFEAKYKRQMTKRAQIKLFHQSNGVKEILSSNKQVSIQVEGIMDGIDYHDKISRTEFEERSAPLFDKLTSPIKRFLFDHDLRPEDLDGVELIGGGIRIPKLQSMISEIIGNQSKIGQHINGDEAMVLGAAFYGANSSKKFKVKGINLYDGFNFEIRAVLKNLQEGISEDDEEYFFKNVTVFSKKSRFGITKELNFKCKENIVIELYREDENGLYLLRSDKLDNIQEVNETDFKVSLTLALDPVEVVLIKKAEIKYKRDQIETYVEKVKKPSVETTEEKNQQEEVADKQQQEQKEEDSGDSTKQEKVSDEDDDDDEEDKKQKKKAKKKKKEPKVQYETVEKNRTVTKKYQRDLHMVELYSQEKADHDQQELSRTLLKNYERVEEDRRKLSESKNKLEALIYEVRDKLENEEFLEYIQDSEKDKIAQILQAKSEWQDETMSENKNDYDENYRELNKPVDRVKRRIEEYHNRDHHLKKAKKVIEEYRDLSRNITKKKEWITEEEVKELLERIDSYEKELEDMLQSMRDTPKNETPTFHIKDFSKATEKAKEDYYKVMATPKPKKQAKEEKSEDSEQEQEKADESDEL